MLDPMIWLDWIFRFYFGAIVLWWIIACANVLLNAFFVPRLRAAETSGHAELPSLSVVIPARNEERDIGSAVASHCDQRYPSFEVIVVDDGSTDRTPRILSELQNRYPRLTILRGTDPPQGWLGKPHAQRLGLDRARGSLVLFADADVIYEQGSHLAAVREMLRHEADMLALIPHQRGEGFWEPLMVSFLDAASTYGLPTFLVNRRRLRSIGLGVGAGNLVSRTALDACGGLEAVRSEIIDDVALGRRLKAYRGRARVALAYGCIEVRMYRGFSEVIEGFTKNIYPAYGATVLRALAAVWCDLSLHLSPFLCLIAAFLFPAFLRPLALPAGIAVAAAILCNAATCLIARHPPWIALAYPIRHLAWAALLLRSMRRFHAGTLTWRGRNIHDGAN